MLIITGGWKGKTFPSTFYAHFFSSNFSLPFSSTSSPIRVVFFSISRRNSCGSTANRLEKKLGQVIPSLYNTTLHNSSLPARRNSEGRGGGGGGGKKKSRCTGTSCADRIFVLLFSSSFSFLFPFSLPPRNFVTQKFPKKKVLIARNESVPTDRNSHIRERFTVTASDDQFTMDFFLSRGEFKDERELAEKYVYFSRERISSTKLKEKVVPTRDETNETSVRPVNINDLCTVA